MRKCLVALLALVMVLAVAACGNGNNNAADGVVRTDINLVVPQPFGTLDPHNMSLIVEHRARVQIFESLLLHEDDGTLTPILALSYDVCDDGVVYTFQIRQGVTFHNGYALTARDVAFSIERAVDSPFMANEVAMIESVALIDNYTVAITARSPFALFAALVGSISIVSEDHLLAAGDDIIDNPVGTGPYMLYAFNRGVNLELVSNPNHWAGSPRIERVNFRIITDMQTALMAFEAGELDKILAPPVNWADLIAQDNWTTSAYSNLHITYFVFNHEVEPFTDVRVRQAINYAINREEMVLFAFEGLATPAYTMANTRFVFGATDDVRVYEFNPDRARELLAEAGFPDGFTLPPILTIGGGTFEVATVTLQAHLREVGIIADVEVREPAAFVADMMAGNFTLGIMGRLTGFDMDLFREVYHTERIDNNNMARFSNPRVDELFEVGMITLDVEARKEAYRELLQIVQEEAVYAPVIFGVDLVAHDRDLSMVQRITTPFRVVEWYWTN